MLLLVAMHLLDKKINEIEKLIKSVLGMKVRTGKSFCALCYCSLLYCNTSQGTLKSGHFSTLKTVFLKVFNESVSQTCLFL